ncbi:MAG TPA: ABC transporter ATP-binding protein [Deltaproteobacteria bacterium]|nr:ABC transporter ATP-binding protein [Deltaproteobacteria bacterium]
MHTDFGYFEEDSMGKPYDVKLLRRLFPFTKPYRMLLFGSIVLVVLITLLDLALPYVTKIAIDRYIVPAKYTVSTDAGEQQGEKKRFYIVDLEDPEIKTVVKKYPRLFQTEGSVSRIEFGELNKIESRDLSLLRSNDIRGIVTAAAVFLILIFASFCFNFLQQMIMEYTGQQIMHDLRLSLFQHIQSLSISFFTKNPVGRLVTRVTNDVQNMHELFTSVISFVFKDLFLLTGIAAVLMSISWRLALVSFAVVPVVLFASFMFAGKARNVFRTLRIKIAEINTTLSETISGMKVIQLFGMETENFKRFKRINHENYMAGMRQIKIFGIFMPFIEFLGVLALAIVILYGGSGVLKESISLGALVAFISYVRMFFRPIRDIAEKYNILQNAMASAERIFLILDTHEKLPQPESPSDAMLPKLEGIAEVAMENVRFEYIPGEAVLKGVSFKVQTGEILAVVGPTGSGKTTMINLIIRFYDPLSGRVLINGTDIRSYPPSLFRNRIAMVMQDPFLFSGTVRDNICQGNRQVSDEEMAEILKASNCRSVVDKMPDGLDTVLSEGGLAMSSGERQLISIARAMARNPDLIILDEATSYIDSETEEKIQNALVNLMQTRTAIVVAHRLTTARNADGIIVMNRGRIIETGTHDQLMAHQGFYHRLNLIQQVKAEA